MWACVGTLGHERMYRVIPVLGYSGKYGAVPRNVWVYFLFWGCARLLVTSEYDTCTRV